MQATTTINDAKPATQKPRKTDRSKSGKTDRSKSGKTVKATIVMDRKLDFLLSTIASYRGLDRSTLAASLIDQGLRKDQGDLYRALESFAPEKAGKASRDTSVMPDESAGDSACVSSPVRLKV